MSFSRFAVVQVSPRGGVEVRSTHETIADAAAAIARYIADLTYVCASPQGYDGLRICPRDGHVDRNAVSATGPNLRSAHGVPAPVKIRRGSGLLD